MRLLQSPSGCPAVRTPCPHSPVVVANALAKRGRRIRHVCHAAACATQEAPDLECPSSSAAQPGEVCCNSPATGVDLQQQQQQALSFSGRHSLYDQQGRLMLKNLTLPELEEWCLSIGEQPRRAMQLWRWMYADACWVASLEETIGRQNGCSASLCAKLAAAASVSGGLVLQQVVRARDGTRKLVFELTDGEGRGGSVEAVLIPVVREAGSKPRITLCVSSEVGCAMNCQFCYTGRMGLLGKLSAAQIVEQLVAARRVQAAEGDSTPITNVVFMGMGEPLNNLDAVLAAADVMCHPLGLHMSHNKVTVSTVGLVQQMEEFVARSGAQLALSLHATTDEVRDWIVPVNRRPGHGLGPLTAALRRHFPAGGRSARRVLIEYVMLRGVNDGTDDAARLLQLLQGVEAKVNLIVFNPHAGTRFAASDMEAVLAFRSVLVAGGRVCTIRDSRGDDEMAACGQLGSPGAGGRPPAPVLRPPQRFLAALHP